ncbi:MAG TPA: c-type cytochrome [Bryobacteraceae bacterium]|jgi:mono/diheme cytochrome c family protein|nr:c-type cytochrome [Bryobacteraceae bacterium]
MKKLAVTAFLLAVSSAAQNLTEVLQQGEQVFAKSCATGYCHGVKGGAGGAPRLVGRHFDQAYINNVVTRGVPDTGMPSFATRLSRPDLVAVIAYVATLNGITNPTVGPGGAAATVSSRPKLTGEAARGARLFTDAVRSFGRCSTCHEVDDLGISVAAPIAKVPSSVAELKALATPAVKTATMDGESMPVLVLSEGKQSIVFYDLTSVPPVQRSAEPGSVAFADGSNWRHSSAVKSYDDSELTAILTYLRAAAKP